MRVYKAKAIRERQKLYTAASEVLFILLSHTSQADVRPQSRSDLRMCKFCSVAFLSRRTPCVCSATTTTTMRDIVYSIRMYKRERERRAKEEKKKDVAYNELSGTGARRLTEDYT